MRQFDVTRVTRDEYYNGKNGKTIMTYAEAYVRNGVMSIPSTRQIIQEGDYFLVDGHVYIVNEEYPHGAEVNTQDITDDIEESIQKTLRNIFRISDIDPDEISEMAHKIYREEFGILERLPDMEGFEAELTEEFRFGTTLEDVIERLQEIRLTFPDGKIKISNQEVFLYK